MTSFIVTTQVMFNDCVESDNSFSSGNSRWKFKGGRTFEVTGVNRVQEAVAFVAAIVMQNNMDVKEFPINWVEGVTEDDDWEVVHVTPDNMEDAACAIKQTAWNI